MFTKNYNMETEIKKDWFSMGRHVWEKEETCTQFRQFFELLYLIFQKSFKAKY